jgi:MerR family transcriptional regulator/heat shock protein HspR
MKNKQNSEITDLDAPLFPISVLATELNVHQRTLRIYDDEGVLVPKRSLKNRRLYSMNDISRGRFIQYLTRELGLNLVGVKVVFDLLPLINKDVSTWRDYLDTIASNHDIDKEETHAKMSSRGRKKTITA